MEHLRLFLDLPLEPVLARDLLKRFKKLNLPWDKLKVVGPEQIHITLKFLGDTPLEHLDKIITALEDIKINHPDLALELESAKIFNSTSPRVLVFTLKPDKNLQILYERIDTALWRANLASKETRRFMPHLTLARVKRSSRSEEYRDFLNWSLPQLNINLNYFELQSSQLTPAGPHYTVLQTFPL